MKTQRVNNLANWLSIIRILLALALIWLILNSLVGWTLFFFVAALSTDYFDGRVARNYNLITDVGKVLDPAADKI